MHHLEMKKYVRNPSLDVPHVFGAEVFHPFGIHSLAFTPPLRPAALVVDKDGAAAPAECTRVVPNCLTWDHHDMKAPTHQPPKKKMSCREMEPPRFNQICSL